MSRLHVSLALLFSVGLLASACDSTSEKRPPTRATGEWSAPMQVGPAGAPAGADRERLPDGQVIAAWAPRPATRGRVLASTRTAEGVWAGPIDAAEPEIFPRAGGDVAIDGQGRAVAAWVLWDRPQGSIFAYAQTATRGSDGRWGKVETLSRGTNGLMAAPVAVLPDGTAMIAWSGSEARDGSYDAALKASARVNGKWQATATILAEEAYDVRIAALPSRQSFVATWQRFGGNSKRQLMSAIWSRAAGWSRPVAVSDVAHRAQQTTSGDNRSGDIVGAWGGGGRGLRTAYRSPTGGWGEAIVLLRSGYVGAVNVTVGPRGRAVVTAAVWPGGKRPARLQAWVIDPSTTGRPTRVLARRPVKNVNARFVTIPAFAVASAFDSDGEPVVAWADMASAEISTAKEIRLARLGGSPDQRVPLDPPAAVGAIALDVVPGSRAVLEWDAYATDRADRTTWQSLGPQG
jgi:hypothetical protein